jgi:hypothetical protein
MLGIFGVSPSSSLSDGNHNRFSGWIMCEEIARYHYREGNSDSRGEK